MRKEQEDLQTQKNSSQEKTLTGKICENINIKDLKNICTFASETAVSETAVSEILKSSGYEILRQRTRNRFLA